MSSHAVPYLKRLATALCSASFLVTPAVLAKIITNAIDPIVSLSDNGRQLVVTGPLSCTAGERLYLRVIVTQRTTAALAEGATFIACTGQLQQWELRATAQTPEAFEAGAATASVSGRTTERGKATDADQWLVPVTLVEQ